MLGLRGQVARLRTEFKTAGWNYSFQVVVVLPQDAIMMMMLEVVIAGGCVDVL